LKPGRYPRPKRNSSADAAQIGRDAAARKAERVQIRIEGLREKLEAEKLQAQHDQLENHRQKNIAAVAEAARLETEAMAVARQLAAVVRAWRHQKDVPGKAIKLRTGSPTACKFTVSTASGRSNRLAPISIACRS
jgi:hypothetical protein